MKKIKFLTLRKSHFIWGRQASNVQIKRALLRRIDRESFPKVATMRRPE
jgi:hypothetical protein